MSDKNLYAYRQENQASEELWFEATGNGLAKTYAEKVTCHGKEKGHNADDKQGKRNG